MQQGAKIVVVSQHYPPDHSTTASIMAAIANRLTSVAPVTVLSGMPGSASQAQGPGSPDVVEIKNRLPEKAALIRRASSEILFTLRTFAALLLRLRRGDVALTVTAPFMLPYAVAVAARLKRARSALIMHDLFPDVLIMAGLLRPSSIVTRLIRGANALMFRTLNAVIVIGRDTEPLLLQYGGMTREKLCFIPELGDVGACAATDQVGQFISTCDLRALYRRPFRQSCFTHDPVVVFEAARLLRDDPENSFPAVGLGHRVRAVEADAGKREAPNVTLAERVPEEKLEEFLSAANVWLIPYRKDLAGVSDAEPVL